MLTDKKLLIRYSLLCDDTSGNSKDISRVAELICSLLSVKLYLLPYTDAQIVIYTLPEYLPRLQNILTLLEIPNCEFLFLNNEEDIAFANSIEHCSPVDRICIRRMLADFRELPTTAFRLLLGNDCYFFRPPQEIIAYTWNDNPPQKVLYMVDNQTFNLKISKLNFYRPYKLRYYRPQILSGLLGDCYCLAPSVSLTRESILSCLKMIDEWPVDKRWKPGLPPTLKNLVHACEQQAAAILLEPFSGQSLPPSLYRNYIASDGCVAIHAHGPWLFISLKVMPQELADAVLAAWKQLGYKEILETIEAVKPTPQRQLKRKVMQRLGLFPSY